MERVSIYTPMGMLGYGFPERSLKNAIAKKPNVIAVDAGSTDPGPYYLGVGNSFTSRTMVKKDLSLILMEAISINSPLIIGSVGGSGATPHLNSFLEVFEEVVKENKLSLKIAVIHSEIDKDFLNLANDSNKIEDFEMGKKITSEDIDRSNYIVAQMGVEPIINALKNDVDVVIAGRAYDAALMAAFPIMKGFSKGLSYHMGKILECGSAIAVPRESDGAIGVISKNDFTIEPADPLKTTSKELVAAHTLYEKTNPVHLHVPGGKLNLENCNFTELDERTVKVDGSKFEPLPYKVKLEGAAFVGYRSICISGIRDPYMIKNLEGVIERVKAKLRRDLKDIVNENEYTFLHYKYGQNAVMGEEISEQINSPEIGLIIEIVAKTQELANTISALARSAMLHTGYESRKANAGNLAFLYTPAEFPGPPAYEFSIYHLLQVEDPTEIFPIEYKEVGE
ncbi:acyclic terpene utilization AtuA family protein [Virgibacillus sp. C22-A2]|uniref:Acyclic terpene utilization AtuA family protein n=1 Tax=Virgibacillus tibetensis TaxID=3042313 RepID=A0ABU6KE00_9BACI|nr:acyclic terpene utilization AtuA family protein [Virgibacillus sp. C22-A2]